MIEIDLCFFSHGVPLYELHNVEMLLMLNCLLTAVKNQATDHLFLNDEGDFPESRTVIEKGVAWEYTNNDDMETLQTTGPLKYGVLIMVRMNVKKKDFQFIHR